MASLAFIGSAISAALPYAATAASVVGGGLQLIGGLQQAQEAERQSQFLAEQQEKQAQQERAIAGSRARETQRQKRLLQSRQLAVAAKTGGASDPSVVSAIADVEAEAELRTLTEQAAGETAAASLIAQAGETRRQGRERARSLRFGAFSSLLEGAVTGFRLFPEGGSTGGGGTIPTYEPDTSYQTPR